MPLAQVKSFPAPEALAGAWAHLAGFAVSNTWELEQAQAVRMFVKSLPQLRHAWFWEALAAFLFPGPASIGSQQSALSELALSVPT